MRRSTLSKFSPKFINNNQPLLSTQPPNLSKDGMPLSHAKGRESGSALQLGG